MYKNIENLKKISGEINNFLGKNNKLCVERKRNNDIYDAISYRLYYTKQCATQEKAAIMVNKYKNKNCKTSRQALNKKDDKLSPEFYCDLSCKLGEVIKKMYYNNNVRQVIAVDGVFSTFKESLSKDGYSKNKKGTSVTPLVTGMFNATYNYPVTLELSKTKDERKSFLDFIKNKDKFENTIFVFDRGYYSDEFFAHLESLNIAYVCRIKDNSKYVSRNNDCTYVVDDSFYIRIIKYKIGDQEYNIATNCFDMKINEIQDVYHKRWSVEEYYKHIKNNQGMAKINTSREKNTKKMIYANLIVSQLAYLFAYMDNKNKKNGKILNKSTLTEGLYDKFIYYFIHNTKFSKYYLEQFFSTYVSYIKTNVGTSSERICKRPNFRWYFKQYFKNPKSKAK